MVTNYYEQICPFCKTQFKEGDDIVICSICEMPHHKDCWIENKGCTTFGCTGTIKEADMGEHSDAVNNTATQKREFYFCSVCGAKNLCSANFCGKCGNKLFKPDIIENVKQNENIPVVVKHGNSSYYYSNEPELIKTNHPQLENYKDFELVNKFVLSNKFTYIKKFKNLNFKKTSISWNWCAFFFNFIWFAYRKMYTQAIALFVLNYVFFLMGTFGSILSIISSVIVAMFADKCYFNYINKKIFIIKDAPQEVQENYCFINGSVSNYAAAVSICLWVVFTFGAIFMTL